MWAIYCKDWWWAYIVSMALTVWLMGSACGSQELRGYIEQGPGLAAELAQDEDSSRSGYTVNIAPKQYEIGSAGVTYRRHANIRGEALGIWNVVAVDPHSTAYGHIAPGDIVVTINGRSTDSITQNEINAHKMPAGTVETWTFWCNPQHPPSSICTLKMRYFPARLLDGADRQRIQAQWSDPSHREIYRVSP